MGGVDWDADAGKIYEETNDIRKVAMTIRTYQAFMITLCVLAGGFVWASFYTDAPYEMFASAVVAVFGGYGYKRLKQKETRYSASGNGKGNAVDGAALDSEVKHG